MTTEIKTPIKPTPPSVPPPANLPPKPSKVVTFSCNEGVWSTEVEVNDENGYFTNRDFNQMTMLLSVRRHQLRRQAYLVYLSNQRKKNPVSLNAGNPVKNDKLKTLTPVEGPIK